MSRIGTAKNDFMSMQLTEEQEGKLLEVRASGKLSKEDYAQFRPELERLISRHGKIRILFEMEDFHGWSAGALWEEIKLDVKYSADVERVAIVGEKKWQQELAKFAKPFTSAEVRYFDRENSVQARAWAAAA
jgi:hypothetical protein